MPAFFFLKMARGEEKQIVNQIPQRLKTHPSLLYGTKGSPIPFWCVSGILLFNLPKKVAHNLQKKK
jgi:hypothetical protein